MSQHVKRLAAPRAWAIARKLFTWTSAPRPGAHAQDASVPLITLLRDYLHLVQRAHEARKILHAGKVTVDGRVVREPKLPVGFMDVVGIAELDKAWRAVYDTSGRLTLAEIPKTETGWKLVRVTGVSTVKGGKLQVHTHDGRNILTRERPAKTGDTLQIRVPSQEIQATFPLTEGAPAFFTGGAHVGRVGVFRSAEIVRSSTPNRAKLRLEGADAETTLEYVFVVGKDAPLVQPAGGVIR